MGGPIGTIPQGLLSLLALKELGKNPATLSDVVSPNLELGQFYFERIAQNEVGLFGAQPQTAGVPSGGHGIIGFTALGSGIVVPNNQMWWVTHMSAAITAGPGGANQIQAADTLRASLVIFPPQQSNFVSVTVDSADIITARARTWVTSPLIRPMFFPPGTSIALAVWDILSAAGSYFFGLNIRAAPIQI